MGEDLGRRLRLFSHNRFNLFSFRDADFGDGGSPRAWVERALAGQGHDFPVGRIELLCFPRVLGYVRQVAGRYRVFHPLLRLLDTVERSPITSGYSF